MGFNDSILVIDDDPMIIQLLCDGLGHAGYRVSSATDAMQAVIQAQALRPKLIISDIQMPAFGTGLEAYANLRKIPSLKNTPVIFLTAMPPFEAKKLMPVSDPKVRLLSKPIDWVMLEQAIQEFLGDGKSLGGKQP